jgi:hypothetical protein
MANKHKTMPSKIFAKYKAIREVDGHPYKVLQVEVPRDGKKPLIAYFVASSLELEKSLKL